MTIFLPQLEVLMKLCRQFWNQTWSCQKIQRKQLTSQTPLKISVQLCFPWKYHRYDFHFTKSYFTKSINITFFFLLEVCWHFTSYRSVSRCWCYHPTEHGRNVIKTVNLHVLPEVMLCVGFLQQQRIPQIVSPIANTELRISLTNICYGFFFNCQNS